MAVDDSGEHHLDPRSVLGDTQVVTAQDAIKNAVRLLQQAEMTTDLALMERLEGLADTWLAIANTMLENSSSF